MNLYLISQTVNDDYDTYSEAGVAAETEAEARSIHPKGDKRLPPGPEIDPDDVWYDYRDWVQDPKDVKVRLIGSRRRRCQAGRSPLCQVPRWMKREEPVSPGPSAAPCHSWQPGREARQDPDESAGRDHGPALRQLAERRQRP